MQQLDNETNELIGEANEIRQTLTTPGWALMEKELDEIIKSAIDMRTLPGDMGLQEKANEVQRRLDAVALLEEWILRIKGKVEQVIENTKPEKENEVSYLKYNK